VERKEEIIKFFEQYIDEFEGGGGGGTKPNETEFDLTPRDFLDFAEKDLEQVNSTHSLINATSNLKRAVDCQLDSFLTLLNLDQFYRKKRLGVDRKLGFLDLSGLFRSKSLEKLNKMRNRLEHYYEVPEIEDVEVYFDLVVAFVSVIEGVVPLIGYNSTLEMSLVSEGRISTEYIYTKPSIVIFLKHKESNYEKEFECDMSGSNVSVDNLQEFAFFFKVHSLLRSFDGGMSSAKHVLKSLKE